MNKLSLPPAEASYSFKRKAEYLYVALEGGLGRTRRDIFDTSRIVRVQWVVAFAGYEYLQNVHRYHVAHDAEAFLIDLILENATPAEFTAKFLPDTFGLQSVDGMRYTVGADLEVLPAGYVEWPNYNGDVGCDCSIIAWFGDFEFGDITTAQDLPLQLGFAYVSAFDDPLIDVVITATGALYGGKSLKIIPRNDCNIEFYEPAVEVPDGWTFNFSVKIDADFLTTAYSRFYFYDASDSERMRLTLETDGAGGFKFNYFHAPTFNSGNSASFAAGTRYNCELNAGGGSVRLYVDGVEAFSFGYGGTNELARFDLLTVTNDPDKPPEYTAGILFDSLRVLNTVEHTEDYTPSVPFCFCAYAAFDIGWFSPPTGFNKNTASTSESGQDDFTSSIGEIRLNFGMVPPPDSGPLVLWRIDSWTPVTPGHPPPILQNDFDGYGTFQVEPSRDPESGAMYNGIAHIKANIAGTDCNGYLILTMYTNDDTGGYGGLAWEHS